MPPPSDPTSWIPILILSSHLRLVLPSSLHSDLLTFILYEPPLSPHTCYMSRSSPSSWFDQRNICCAVHIMKLLVFLHYPGTSSLLGPNSPDSMGVSNVPVGYHVEPTLYALNVLWCAETFCRTSKVWRIYLGHIRLVLQPNYHITHSTYNIQIVPVRIAGSTEINTESRNYGGGGGARWRSG